MEKQNHTKIQKKWVDYESNIYSFYIFFVGFKNPKQWCSKSICILICWYLYDLSVIKRFVLYCIGNIRFVDDTKGSNWNKKKNNMSDFSC